VPYAPAANIPPQAFDDLAALGETATTQLVPSHVTTHHTPHTTSALLHQNEIMHPPHKKHKPTYRPSKEPAPEEILFSPTSRHDYLTGFHRRKLARIKHAREVAEKREREERLSARRERREERKSAIRKAVEGAGVEEGSILMRGLGAPSKEGEEEGGEMESGKSEVGKGGKGKGEESDGSKSSGEEEGSEDEVMVGVDKEDEYVDEDRYTTVLVEEVSVDRDGLHANRQPTTTTNDDHDDEQPTAPVSEVKPAFSSSKRKWTASRPTDKEKKPKVKRKKFRYETKAERKVNREKERRGNKKAARARRERD
jgi:ribosomal RNA-processing protein 17